MSYHLKRKRCYRCGLICIDVEWRVLLDEFMCWECRSRIQLENLRRRGKGDGRAVRVEIEVVAGDSPLPTPNPAQLDLDL